MKKLILTFASLCLVLSIYSCRETKEEKVEVEVEEMADDAGDAMEEAGDAIEDAVDDTGDAMENAANDVEDAMEGTDDN
jgi:phosphate uptake regulator